MRTAVRNVLKILDTKSGPDSTHVVNWSGLFSDCVMSDVVVPV